MANNENRRWYLIRENIKFQIKLMLDAVRDLMLSPVATVCTVLDLMKGNSVDEGHFQRLMQWGHNTDHWLNLFGDLPPKKNAENQVDNSTVESDPLAQEEHGLTQDEKGEGGRVDKKLDSLFSKIEDLLDEQQGGLTTSAKQTIAEYMDGLNSSNSHKPAAEKQLSSEKIEQAESTSAQTTKAQNSDK